MLILYVDNQQRSRDFYAAVFGVDPILDVPGMTELLIESNTVLGLMPADGIAKILGDAVPHPASAAGIPRCEIYLTVSDPEAYLDRAIQHGATPISPVQRRDWGEEVGYCADVDGHVLAFSRGIAD